MRAAIACLAGALSLCGTSLGLPEISIAKRRHADVNPARLKKRQSSDGTVETNTYDVLTWSVGGAYYANVTVGNPPQDQVVILDTGSSDLYFDSSTANSCRTTGQHSCRGGTFDHGASSTYEIVAQSPAFNTSFGDGSTALGPFAEDTIGIGDVRIDGVQFGVADEVDSTTGFAVGLMGLGYSYYEASKRQYPNIPEVLASSGEIASRLYSVYLNDIGETSGSVLFGGIDKSKYTGPLVTLNLLPHQLYDEVVTFITTVTALSVTVDSKESEMFSGGTDSIDAYNDDGTTLPVLLDTGSAAWSVPEALLEKLLPSFSFLDEHLQCDCKYRDASTSITLTFGNAINITVPISSLIVPMYDPMTNEPVPYVNGANPPQACTFMIVPGEPTQSGFLTLGDSVLRSMYIVFDLDNGQVSLAQAAVNSTSGPDIVTVGAGPDGVAKAAAASKIEANSYSVAVAVSGGETFTASKVNTAVGTATGIEAVPTDARPIETEAGAGGGESSAAASSGAAGMVEVPGLDLHDLGSLAVCGLMMVFGGFLML